MSPPASSQHNLLRSTSDLRRSARIASRTPVDPLVNPPTYTPAAMDAGLRDMMSMMTFMLSKVTKLDKHNYSQWKLDMELRLTSAGLWGIINDARPARPDAAWIKNEATVLADIRQHCEPHVRALIITSRVAKEAWDALKSKFEQNTDENKNRLWGDFNITMKHDESMQDYIVRMKAIVTKLRDLDETVPDGRIVDRLIHGLTRKYADLGRGLRLQKPSLDDCENMMLLEERLLEDATHDKENFTYDLPSRDGRRCRTCGRLGHLERDCRMVICNGCGRIGHIERDCWVRHPEKRPSGPRNDYAARNDYPRQDRNDYQRNDRNDYPRNDRYDYQRNDRNDARNDFAGRNNYPRNDRNDYRNDRNNYRNDKNDYRNDNRYTPYPRRSQNSGYGNNNIIELANGQRQPAPLQANMALDTNETDRNDQFDFPVQPHHAPDYDHFAQMAIANEHRPSNTHLWLVDSGATNHYTAFRDLLLDYQELDPIPILTGRGYIYARGIGNITIHLSIGPVTIQNVMWVPDLAGQASLLSVPQLAHNGCKIVFENDLCQIHRNGYTLATASFNGKAYYLDLVFDMQTAMITIVSTVHPIGDHHYKLSNYSWLNTDLPPPTKRHQPTTPLVAMLHGSTDCQPIDIWHKRLGHLNHDDIKLLTTMSSGIEIGPRTHNQKTCIPCLHGAQHKHISRVPRLPADKKLEIVHIDIKGPCGSDVHGFKYWVNFLCEKTRFNRGYALQFRSEIFNAYLAFEAVAERESNSRILALMMDGSQENLSNDWRTHCINKGIQLRTTAPYSPEMNGMAERLIRVLVEHASAMLWDAELPIGFWAAAMSTANFLRNRSPTKALDGITPYEAWYGKRPNLGFIRIFGCKAMVHVPKEIRSKTDWDSHTTECILIGYSDTENLYELWDIHRGASIKRRDVIFIETELGSTILKGRPLPRGTPIFDFPAQYTTQHLGDNPRPTPPIQSPVLPLPRRPPQQTVNKLPQLEKPPSIVFQPPVVQPVDGNSTYPEITFAEPLGVNSLPQQLLLAEGDVQPGEVLKKN